jgi:hypothetical protein
MDEGLTRQIFAGLYGMVWIEGFSQPMGGSAKGFQLASLKESEATKGFQLAARKEGCLKRLSQKEGGGPCGF